MTRRYAPIGEYGVIGDLHTVALVGMDGSIDFLCLPHFDSPSVFAALLDAERGGRFQIAPLLDGAARKQLYLPDTNVLLTRFLDADGRRRGLRLHAGGRRGAGAQPRAPREDGARRGALPDALRAALRLRARDAHGRASSDREVLFVGRCGDGELALRLRSSVPLRSRTARPWPSSRSRADESAWFVLEVVLGAGAVALASSPTT